jgi:hypothetical protein
MVPIGAVSHEDGLTGLAGVLASGRAGPGGWQISGGRFMAGAPFWSDIQGTVLRTSAAPLKGTGHSTYVGGEVGIAPFPVGLLHGHFLMARPTLGVLRRVEWTGRARRHDVHLERQHQHLVWVPGTVTRSHRMTARSCRQEVPCVAQWLPLSPS